MRTNTPPGTILRLALEGSPSECHEHAGMPRYRVIQDALRLAADPAVALAHPVLVRRVQDREMAARARRQLG